MNKLQKEALYKLFIREYMKTIGVITQTILDKWKSEYDPFNFPVKVFWNPTICICTKL